MTKPDLGFSAYAIDDVVYNWRVKMYGFTNQELKDSLISLNELYGYDYVEFDVSFKEDLYPFYPPLVQIIRPRFQGFIIGRITGMDTLKLENWNPLMSMEEVLSVVMKLMDSIAVLDFNHDMNDKEQFKEGAYTKLEHGLWELEVLVDLDPRSKKKYPPTEEEKQAKEEIRKQKELTAGQKGSEKTYWAKGTGYGFDDYDDSYGYDYDEWGTPISKDPNQWTLESYMAAQKEKDIETQKVMEKVNVCLENLRQFPNEAQELQAIVIEESCLIPFLERYLENESLLDINRHREIYTTIFDTLKALAQNDNTKMLLKKLPEQRTSLQDLLLIMNNNANFYSNAVNGELDDEDIVLSIFITHAIVQSALEVLPETTPLFMLGWVLQNPTDEDGLEGPSEEDTYCRLMKPLQFDHFDLSSESSEYVHYYITNETVSTSKERIIRIAQETGSLSNSLPLNISSSVFLKVDEDRIDLMSAIITGPEDTPYSGGVFVFDIFFGDDYPDGPMKVWLKTTGNGSVRFNPNLYDSGKVCLSLLGTWSGSAGETWNKSTSTLLQVLVSIQSLILVPDPYFNEPGYESDIGTSWGDQASKEYNQVIVEGTIRYAMIEQIRNPAPCFKEEIKRHFFLQKDRILKIVSEWRNIYTGLDLLYNELSEELNNLSNTYVLPENE
eukprot:TRINITY_DN2777_c0_g1_i2.p1 TRINITY_DN2777_c0_g1~~TRINITY_DN2777_c0_g1_i2.p1  ORF type:complete len:667 (+),score=161.68 TRINITY_DN2777_c0_g1_i2:599-2599(+)